MRLLIITSFYPPSIGAGASRTYDFARLLSSRGHEVTVLTFLPFPKLSKARSEASSGVRVFYLPWLGFKHPIDQIFTGLVSSFLLSVAGAVDFVICSVPMGEPCIGAYWTSRLLGRHLVIDVRDEWEEAVLRGTKRFATRRLYAIYRQLFGRIYRRSRLVTTVTPTLVSKLKARGVSQVHLVPNAADTELFHPGSKQERSEVRKALGLRENDVVLVYVGVVGWYYKLDIVLKALHDLVFKRRLSNLRLVVVGDGDKRADWIKLAMHLKIETNVAFVGAKRLEEVARILGGCDVGLIPLDDDPIRLSAYTSKFFEYCASGLPTILSVLPNGDLERLIKENDVGIVVAPLDADKMTQAITRLYDDSKVRKGFGANARELAVERFSRQRIIAQFEELLKTRL